MYTWATLLSKRPPYSNCNMQIPCCQRDPQNCNSLFFQRVPLIHLFLMLHISIWGIKAFCGVLSGDGTGIFGPLWQRGPPNWGVWSAADTALAARILPKDSSGAVRLSICLTALTFGVPFTFQLLLSVRNLTYSWGRRKAASFSENINVIYVVCTLSYDLAYIMTSGESRIIFLPERSSICQYPPKISAISVISNQEQVYFWPTLYRTF